MAPRHTVTLILTPSDPVVYDLRLKDDCSILRLSGPLKSQFAKDHGLDFSRLLDATKYKEKYRADMIAWGEMKRKADPGYFCRIICSGPGSEKPVWIISDARRQTDLNYFFAEYADRVKSVRVVADNDVRISRGWVFTPGVDDAESECDLDGCKFDLVIENNGTEQQLNRAIGDLVAEIKGKLSA